MKKASVLFHRKYIIGTADKRLAGSFVEHISNCVYGGIYNKSHPSADNNGFRSDLKDPIKSSGIKLIRYPGGNFVSGYNWKDGIGPRSLRPRRWNDAWGMEESNEVGTDEMARYLKELGIEMMMAVNMGTGTPREAAELVEYCNIQGGTSLSEMRCANGSPEPYGIKLWCVGNEMDGPWQIGRLSAEAYAEKYIDAACRMKNVDPSIELVACGSCSNEPAHGTFGEWDHTVLEAAYNLIDYISIHRYYGYDVEQNLYYSRLDTFDDIPAMPVDLDDMLSAIEGAIKLTKIRHHSRRRINISLDELSVLPHYRKAITGETVNAYREIDAVLYGALLCVLLQHADYVRINCQSLLVNENGMFTTLSDGRFFTQSIIYPFSDLAHYARGYSLKPALNFPETDTPHYGKNPYITTACTWDEEEQTGTVFIANLSANEKIELKIKLEGFPAYKTTEHWAISSDDPYAVNSEIDPLGVKPENCEMPVELQDGLCIILQPHSWHVLRFSARVN